MGKKNFTIIQLTRLGDIIQTTQAAKDFRVQHPDIELNIICRKEFGLALSFILKGTFDNIIYISKDELLEGCDNDLDLYLSSINKWLSQEVLQNIDVLLNFSFCETSNRLSTLITAKNRLGTFSSPQNQTLVKDQWSQLVYSMVMSGPHNPYNLVDIYKNILGIKERSCWTDNDWQPKEAHEVKTLGIHPFASQDKKKWKPAKWTEVIYKLLKDEENILVEIFGSNSEVEFGEQILNSKVLSKFKDRITNNVGKLSLEQTYYRLGRCSHFVGHDSLLGHLAKLHNLPTLTIALGTVRPIETAPYGHNTFVMAPRTKCFPCFPKTDCSFYQCHADLSYQAVTETLKTFIIDNEINFKVLNNSISPFHLDSVDIFRLGPTNAGWYAAEKLGNDHPTSREVFKDILRVALSYKFEEVEEIISLPATSRDQKRYLEQINDGVRQIFELCEFGKKYSGDILREVSQVSPDLEKIKTFANKIDEVDRLMDLLGKTYNDLKPVIDYYKIVKFNLEGENIVELSESSYIVYDDNSITCSILYELIGKCLPQQEARGKSTEGNV